MTVTEFSHPSDKRNFYDLPLEEQAKYFERIYWKITSDYFHDMMQDGEDYYEVRKLESRAWSELDDMTIFFYKEYYETGRMDELKKVNYGNLIIERVNNYIENLEEEEKQQEANKKRKETLKKNHEAKFARFCVKALEDIHTPELKELLNDDGSLKERRSWGTIKDYLDTDEGDLLKRLWKLQFSS